MPRKRGARSGSNSYSTGNAQSYDAWGGVRSGSSTEDQGYVANLGHRKDAESSLLYMRARYYEPSTGRFVSQDPSRNEANWYVYATNDPVNRSDKDGRLSDVAIVGIYIFLSGLFSAIMTAIINRGHNDALTIMRAFAEGALIGAAQCAEIPALKLHGIVLGAIAGAVLGYIEAIISGGDPVLGALGGAVVGGLGGVVSVVGAASMRQLELFYLLSFDVGAAYAVTTAIINEVTD